MHTRSTKEICTPELANSFSYFSSQIVGIKIELVRYGWSFVPQKIPPKKVGGAYANSTSWHSSYWLTHETGLKLPQSKIHCNTCKIKTMMTRLWQTWVDISLVPWNNLFRWLFKLSKQKQVYAHSGPQYKTQRARCSTRWTHIVIRDSPTQNNFVTISTHNLPYSTLASLY